MENLTIENFMLAFLGMSIHIMMKIYERKHQETPFSFKVFFTDGMNWIRIGLAIASVTALMIMAEDLSDMFGIELNDDSTAKNIFSFLAGYLNHSLIRNILKRFKNKIQND